MKGHLRGNLILLLFTVGICCGLYPLLLLGIGRVAFPSATSGSLIADAAGETRGSLLLAQPFTADAYFWPRPSAASYNATASSGSNLGPSNPKLRDRAAQQLGPIIAYKAGSRSAGGRTPQQDIEAWVTATGRGEGGDPDTSIAATFFDAWLGDPANAEKAADLEPVPVDMITASGSGLDPHITARNALSVYQLDRVARARASSPGELDSTRQRIRELVDERSFTPLSGLVGEPLVNVLELNLALDQAFPKPAAP